MIKILINQAKKNKKYIKYVISGVIAALTQIALLFIFTEFFKIWYIISTSMAFVVAFFVSFYLQKFWTFRDNSKDKMYKQMSVYFTVAVTNLFINAGAMYMLVEKYNLWYILAQFIIGFFIAFENYIIYNFLIFKKKNPENNNNYSGSKKILIATGIYPPDIGGPATYSETLYNELPKYGYKVKVVTYSDNLNKEDNIYKISRGSNILVRYIKYFLAVWNLANWADAIYIQGPVSEGLPSWLACKLKSKKYYLKIVGDYAWEQGRQRYGVEDMLDDFQNKKYNNSVERMRKIQRKVAREADKIITPSNYLKSVIKKWEINDEKIRVIYNSVKNIDDINKKEEIRNELSTKGDVIISVGRLVPWKGFDILISIMPELLKVNSNFKLLIAGEGPERNNLELKIKKLELDKSVKLIGSLEQKELWKYMRASDMFVLNTGYEGLPHIIIEAMQLELPVITTRVGGNGEVVFDNENGLLVEYNNKKEIKEAIINLWKNEDKRIELARRAKEGLGKFGKQEMINNLIDVIG